MKELEGRRVVLASASPRRKELLLQAGIRAEILPSHKEERSRAKTPAALVKALSAGKAEDIAAGQPDGTIVIGSDTVVVRDGEILGKPKDPADCKRMLSALSGRMHKVVTGVAIFWDGRSASFSDETQVQFYPLSDAEIDAYAATGEPYDKAGAYGIQGRGALLAAGIHGDFYNVVGLPVARLARQLRSFGLL